MSQSDGVIHFDGTADGPEHQGTSMGFDGGGPPSLHGPADDPTGSGGMGGINDGAADGALDAGGLSGFDGVLDSPIPDQDVASGNAEGESASDEDWEDEGADEPGAGEPDDPRW